MESLDRLQLQPKVVALIREMQAETADWVPLAALGGVMNVRGIPYKQYGYLKLRPFLDEFADVLEFYEDYDGRTPVYYVRLKENYETPAAASLGETAASTVSAQTESAPPVVSPTSAAVPLTPSCPPQSGAVREPTASVRLTDWANISHARYSILAELALPERWYYGNEDDLADTKNRYPILKNYLIYTFMRLCYEGKVMLATDPQTGEEYAAFNTGLVDSKYEYIYAMFKRESKYSQTYYWYLHAFAVAGEDEGKTLVRLFNPLPAKANYFGNKIESMLYDTSTGALSCDYTHILVERCSRFPVEFFEDNCPESFTTINGVKLSDIPAANDYVRESYFDALSEKISNDTRILKRLKNRFEDAVELAIKRVEWNYKTAIPMYFPTRNSMSLLLPLALVDEDKIDLALVVERHPSGSYQGQTVLPLDLAYSNSRLVTRPDSDWLKTDVIINMDSDQIID